MALSPSHPVQRLSSEIEGRALSLLLVLTGKAAPWGKLGKARPELWDSDPLPARATFPEPVLPSQPGPLSLQSPGSLENPPPALPFLK